MVRLGDVCEILNGYAFKSENYTDAGVRIIRISNVQKGYIEDNAPAFYPFDDLNVEKYKLFEGDLLLSLTGNVGRVGLLDKKFLPAALNQRVACVRIKDSTVLDKSFLFNLLNSDSFEQKCILSSKGIAQKNMSTEWLKDYKISLPPLGEQRKIAAVLDKVSNLITKRRQQLDKLDEMVKARFVEIFGDPETNTKNWRVLPMSEICSIGSSKRIYQSEQSSFGVPFWRISDLTNLINTGAVTPDLYIPEERYTELKSQGQVPSAGDILITSRGTLGQCYIVKDEDKFYFQDGMISWLSGYMENITPLYLSYLFTMSGFRKQIDSMQAGSTVAYLSIAMIKKLKVMLPDMDNQQQFTYFVEQSKKIKANINYSLGQLETLKKTLMQEYFR